MYCVNVFVHVHVLVIRDFDQGPRGQIKFFVVGIHDLNKFPGGLFPQPPLKETQYMAHNHSNLYQGDQHQSSINNDKQNSLLCFTCIV